MAIAALVLGIVGLVLSFVPCLGMYAMPLTILAAILGALGMKKAQGKGMAIAGLVMGIIGTAIAGFWLYAVLTAKKAANDFDKDMDKAAKDLDKQMKEMDKEMAKPDKPTTETPPPADKPPGDKPAEDKPAAP